MTDSNSVVVSTKENLEYKLDFEPNMVNVFYQGSEISNILRHGFAPRPGESIKDLESRLIRVKARREELLKEVKYEPLPTAVVDKFEQKYNATIDDVVVTASDDTLLLIGYNAYFSREKGGVGVVTMTRRAQSTAWEHELLHAMTRDNPHKRKYTEKTAPYKVSDLLMLPVIYSPADVHEVFLEALPPVYTNEHKSSLIKYPLSATNRSYLLAVPGIISLATLLGYNIHYAEPFITFFLLSTFSKVPRAIKYGVNMLDNYFTMRDLKEGLGVPESLKLLVFADRKALKEIVNFVNENDIRFCSN